MEYRQRHVACLRLKSIPTLTRTGSCTCPGQVHWHVQPDHHHKRVFSDIDWMVPEGQKSTEMRMRPTRRRSKPRMIWRTTVSLYTTPSLVKKSERSSKFCFCTDTPGSIEWPSLAPRLHTGDCFEIAIVTDDLVICCCQVPKIFSTKYGSAIASSAWGPCNFGPFTDLAISVFREMSMNIMFTQILTTLECGL